MSQLGRGDEGILDSSACGTLNETMLRHARGRLEDAGPLHAVVPPQPEGVGYLLCPGSVALLEIFFAEHVQVAESQRAIADPGQERGELSGLGPAGVLHALLV